MRWTDKQIGAAEGKAEVTIQYWRLRNGLPSHHATKAPTKDQVAERIKLHESGLNNTQIAAIVGVSHGQMGKWLTKNGLQSNFVPMRGVRRKRRGYGSWTPTVKARPEREEVVILRRIRAAVGHGMSAHDADDAVADVFEGILRKVVPLDGIKAAAREARHCAIRGFSSKFSRSLDAPIGDNGFTLLDTLVDHSASSWLEEMGATVW